MPVCRGTPGHEEGSLGTNLRKSGSKKHTLDRKTDREPLGGREKKGAPKKKTHKRLQKGASEKIPRKDPF